MPHNIHLINLLWLLILTVLLVPLFRKLRLGSILGFLTGGILAGPGGLGLINDRGEMAELAEFGVVFMLFVIGLEIKAQRLWSMRHRVFGLGGAQLLITGTFLSFIAYHLEFEIRASIIIGYGLALSSTAFVLQILAERNELNTVHGRCGFGILLLQDLAVVPLFALISVFSNQDTHITMDLGYAALQTIAIVIVFALFGRFLLRPVLEHVADAQSAEVFSATALLLVLGAGWAMDVAGLSMSMGAFLAGLLLSESRYRHQLLCDVEPFRGLLMGLFFMAVGMRLDPNLLVSQPLLILALLSGLLLIKGSLIFALAFLARHSIRDACRVALLLGQAGEFSMILFSAAGDINLIDVEQKSLLLIVVTLSMLLTPVLAWLSSLISAGSCELDAPNIQSGMKFSTYPRIIVVGFGRIGKSISKMLTAANISYIAVDIDRKKIDAARKENLPVFYGNAEHRAVLESLGAKSASVMILAHEHPEKTLQVVNTAKETFPHLVIYTLARDLGHAKQLYEAGVNEVVPAALEASLQLASLALKSIGHGEQAVNELKEKLREDGYRSLISAQIQHTDIH